MIQIECVDEGSGFEVGRNADVGSTEVAFLMFSVTFLNKNHIYLLGKACLRLLSLIFLSPWNFHFGPFHSISVHFIPFPSFSLLLFSFPFSSGISIFIEVSMIPSWLDELNTRSIFLWVLHSEKHEFCTHEDEALKPLQAFATRNCSSTFAIYIKHDTCSPTWIFSQRHGVCWTWRTCGRTCESQWNKLQTFQILFWRQCRWMYSSLEWINSISWRIRSEGWIFSSLMGMYVCEALRPHQCPFWHGKSWRENIHQMGVDFTSYYFCSCET